MTDKPKLARQDLRGIANLTYIPGNAKRLEAKFGNRRDATDPIRDEIERAYEEGYWTALEAAQAEVERLRALEKAALEFRGASESVETTQAWLDRYDAAADAFFAQLDTLSPVEKPTP